MKKESRGLLKFNSTFRRVGLALCLALGLTITSGGCFSSDEGETFYGSVKVPAGQEFRWSDGGLPQIFDPALAAAPPDTDVVRAMFEGLTEYAPQNLSPISGVAIRWESAAEDREWTFHLRQDARWSNGEPVTAHDFVRSWQRTLQLGERAPHARLLANLEGAQVKTTTQSISVPPPTDIDERVALEDSITPAPKPSPETAKSEFGVEAVNDLTLKVRLQKPDKNFPALVAHPVFRPVYQSESEKESERVETDVSDGGENSNEAARKASASPVISNGAFNLSAQAVDGVVLERASSYWNAKIVSLERIRFVAAPDAEAALSAYRAGEIDAVTNANIEPLAMKLLSPYQDFRRATFGALTYYDFNITRPPFNDRRVRQALSLAIDRQRLSADTLEGATEAADKFLPTPGDMDEQGAKSKERSVSFNPEQARRLLAEAGFPHGIEFPRIRLLVNRNEQHRAVAVAIAEMWRNVLGIETDIMLRNWDEYEAALRSGDYDVARRSHVMQAIDEQTNMLAMFAPDRLNFETAPEMNASGNAEPQITPSRRPDRRGGVLPEEGRSVSTSANTPRQISTEQQALEDLPAIPIYFASSYALVKPYVAGFDSNLLDAPSLQHVRIDTNWQPPKRDSAIRIVRNR